MSQDVIEQNKNRDDQDPEGVVTYLKLCIYRFRALCGANGF